MDQWSGILLHNSQQKQKTTQKTLSSSPSPSPSSQMIFQTPLLTVPHDQKIYLDA